MLEPESLWLVEVAGGAPGVFQLVGFHVGGLFRLRDNQLLAVGEEAGLEHVVGHVLDGDTSTNRNVRRRRRALRKDHEDGFHADGAEGVV